MHAADDLDLCCCRHVANGEILGVSLLLEDILQAGHQDSGTFVALGGVVEDDGKSRKSGSSRPTSSYSMISAGRSKCLQSYRTSSYSLGARIVQLVKSSMLH